MLNMSCRILLNHFYALLKMKKLFLLNLNVSIESWDSVNFRNAMIIYF